MKKNRFFTTASIIFSAVLITELIIVSAAVYYGGGGEPIGEDIEAASTSTPTGLNYTTGDVSRPTASVTIYGEGITTTAGANPGVTAEFGVGPTGTDPSTWEDWIFAPFTSTNAGTDTYSLMVPILPAGSYDWGYRVRCGDGPYYYADSDGFTNGFNAPGTITITAATDNDADGVADNIENAAPNGGDGNGDSIPDVNQDNVTSLPLFTSGGDYVSVASEPGTVLEDVQTRGLPNPAALAPNISLPVNAISYRVTGLTPGGSTYVDLHFEGGVPWTIYCKYGPRPTFAPAWYDFAYDGTTGAQFFPAQNRIRLHFVDGQRGDSDLTVNGEIIDPGAPAFNTATIDQWTILGD